MKFGGGGGGGERGRMVRGVVDGVRNPRFFSSF